jgi:hypothetical protein
LTELDIEEREGLDAYKIVDEDQDEDDDVVAQEGSKEEELVSSQDIEHSVIVVTPRR